MKPSRKAQEAFRKTNDQQTHLLLTALDAAANSIVITDCRGNIEWVNTAFTSLTGYSKNEVIGKNPKFLKSGKQTQEFYENLWKTISTGNIWRGEIINKRKDGSLYTEDMTIAPVRDHQNEIEHFIAIKQDISERKNLEEQYLQSQKMESVGKLAGGVAHDFNNLLTIIMGFITMRQKMLPPDDPIQGDFREIAKALDRAVLLTRQLLAFSRRQIIESKVVNLNDCVSSVNKMLRQLIPENIELTFLLESDLGSVKADPNKIEHVLFNLIDNACDAMPEGGEIIIKTSKVEFGKSYCFEHVNIPAGDYVVLSVSDKGVGIPEEVKTHIFEPFFTTKGKGKGTGLGLASCYGIIKQHNGHLTVYSELGHGTCFNIYLPKVNEKSQLITAKVEAKTIPSGNETILLVEDEYYVKNLAGKFLSDKGYRVLQASNGEEAIRLIQDNPSEKIDIIFTDIIMPQMGGIELLKRLRAVIPGIKALLTSGYVFDEGVLVSENLGPSVFFLQKPYTEEILLLKIREVLDQNKTIPKAA